MSVLEVMQRDWGICERNNGLGGSACFLFQFQRDLVVEPFRNDGFGGSACISKVIFQLQKDLVLEPFRKDGLGGSACFSKVLFQLQKDLVLLAPGTSSLAYLVQ